MERANIIVKGEVQGVGYRDVVKKIAIKLDIVGRVKNVKPYNVRIIAEGEEENLNHFIEKIRIKEFPVDVEDLDTKREEPTGEYDTFEIERGGLEEELGERLDIARDIMTQMIKKQEQTTSTIREFKEESRDKQDQMLGKQDQMLGKQDQTIDSIKVLGEKIDSGFDKTDQDFTTLGEKIDRGFDKTDNNFTTLRQDYGRISETMEKIAKSLEKMAEKS